MAERQIRYSRDATRDLDLIWDYSAETWDPVQADTYLGDLRHTIQTLSEMPRIARERKEFNPPVRIHPSAKHLIVFVADDTTLTVIRILSPRQNWQALLGET